jgi:hypothetical protein
MYYSTEKAQSFKDLEDIIRWTNTHTIGVPEGEVY